MDVGKEMTTLKQGVTVIVNLHREGHLAWRSLLSAEQALNKFLSSHEKRKGEILVVLDSADRTTHDLAMRFNDSRPPLFVNVISTSHSDLGQARNTGVSLATYDHVAFLDADDIFGSEWLSRGWEYLQKQEVPTIAHCQVNLNFERDMLFWQHTDSRDPDFDPSVFCVTNHWTALSMAPTSVYREHPYKRASAELALGFEDWEWNTRTLAAGFVHAVVPETVHFIRKRPGSMSDTHASQTRAIAINDFWRKPWTNKAPPTPSPRDCGEWLTKEWKVAHEVEAELWPHPRELLSRPTYTQPKSELEYKTYNLINDAIPTDATHVIFFAGYGGGADLRVGMYADAIKAAGGRVALIATQTRSGGFKDHPTIEAHKALAKMSPPVQARLIQRLMRRHREDGKTMHVVNSAVAWGALGANAKLFTGREEQPKIFGSLYARELYADGSSGGFAFNGAFGSCMSAVDTIITDNTRLPNELKRCLGWSNTIVALSPVASPLKTIVENPPHEPDGVTHVLWAGRFDWNKNLAHVVKLAKAALNRPFYFTVYGTPADWHGQNALAELKTLPNCTYVGGFKSWADMAEGWGQDALLSTSFCEGQANVELEAAVRGLSVVSSTTTDANCYLPLEASFDEWLLALANAKKMNLTEHTTERFSQALEQSGYFDTINAKAAR